MSHIHEKIDFTADAFIVHKNKVLLRIHDKYHVWLQIGGHIELNEDPIEALFREIEEECGLKTELVGDRGEIFDERNKRLPVPRFLHRHKIKQGEVHEHINCIYVLKALTTEIKPRENEVPTEFKWFTSEELSNPQYEILPHVQFYAKEAIKIAAQD
ncbi:MAG: NUDIX domain-containing protein [Candidatus Doudnabacteria bacterium]|nr:NUDIX domain-containing protein [Candidatus Doudnabacteria bacterium]